METSKVGLIFFAIFKFSYGFEFPSNFKFDDFDFVEAANMVRKSCPVAPSDSCPPELTYWFYTSQNREGEQLNLEDLGNAGFLPDEQFKILIHGYTNDHTSLMITTLKDAYLDSGDFNVIAVDWGHFVKPGCYPEGRLSINPVAGCVTDFLRTAVGEENFGRVHLLGHSLGAHVSARVSSHFDNPKIARLTRFDPANPGFLADKTEEGIAEFRDTYHSNSEVLGQKSPQGDVDVYLNNDSFQPGCACDVACSHMRSVQYFAESIGGDMKGFHCDFWEEFVNGQCTQPTTETLVDVGDRANTEERGKIKVFGKPEPPFLYSEEEYLDSEKFAQFKELSRGECAESAIQDMGDKVKDALLNNEVSDFFKGLM